MDKRRSQFNGNTILPLFFCCQLATLGLLRHTPTYSVWGAEIVTYPTLSLWIARILSVLVFFIALALLSKDKRLLHRRALIAANGTGLLLGFVLTFFYANNLPAFFIGQCLIGISHAWILVCWAEYLTSLEKTDRNRSIAIAALLAVLITTIMGAIPDAAKAVFFLAITFGSAMPLLFASYQHPHSETSRPIKRAAEGLGDLAAIPWELIVLMASYAMLFRILVFFDFSVTDDTLQIAIAAAVRIGGMALLLLYLSRVRFAPNIQQVILPLFFLTILGLLLLPGREGAVASAAVAFIQSSWTFFYVLTWLILPELASTRKANPLVVLVGGWTALNVLLLLAAPLAYFFEIQVSQGTLSLTALILIIVYTLAVALLLYRNSAKRTADPTIPSWEKGQEEHFAELAEVHGLTPREGEIFLLLVQGYSLPAIEKEFVLSHSTVKTHARHIYEKFGVSGKQELIEFVKRG